MTETRVCKKCGEELPLTEQYFTKNQSTNTGGDKYFRPECKKCNKKMVNGRKEAYKAAGQPETPNYGYDPETKKTKNGYPCGCCGKPNYSKQVVFDHDHETLKFRGWICDGCNRSLGILGDNLEGLSNALSYVIGRKLSTEEIVTLINKEIEKKSGSIG